MRKVIASPFVTLDGFFAGPHGEEDWAVGGEEFDRDLLPELLRRVDAIVLGRVTYQELAAFSQLEVQKMQKSSTRDCSSLVSRS